jgi:hypothetical protein
MIKVRRSHQEAPINNHVRISSNITNVYRVLLNFIYSETNPSGCIHTFFFDFVSSHWIKLKVLSFESSRRLRAHKFPFTPSFISWPYFPFFPDKKWDNTGSLRKLIHDIIQRYHHWPGIHPFHRPIRRKSIKYTHCRILANTLYCFLVFSIVMIMADESDWLYPDPWKKSVYSEDLTRAQDPCLLWFKSLIPFTQKSIGLASRANASNLWTQEGGSFPIFEATCAAVAKWWIGVWSNKLLPGGGNKHLKMN